MGWWIYERIGYPSVAGRSRTLHGGDASSHYLCEQLQLVQKKRKNDAAWPLELHSQP